MPHPDRGYANHRPQSGEAQGHMSNLASVLVDTAQKHGDRTAIKLDDVEVMY